MPIFRDCRTLAVLGYNCLSYCLSFCVAPVCHSMLQVCCYRRSTPGGFLSSRRRGVADLSLNRQQSTQQTSASTPLARQLSAATCAAGRPPGAPVGRRRCGGGIGGGTGAQLGRVSRDRTSALNFGVLGSFFWCVGEEFCDLRERGCCNFPWLSFQNRKGGETPTAPGARFFQVQATYTWRTAPAAALTRGGLSVESVPALCVTTETRHLDKVPALCASVLPSCSEAVLLSC